MAPSPDDDQLVVGPFRSGRPRHPAIGPPPLPDGGWAALDTGEPTGWEQRWVKPGSQVWRIVTGDGPRWLKIADRAGHDDLAGERDRLTWMADQLVDVDDAPRIPAVVGSAADATATWLLTAEVPGVAAHEPLLRMGSIEGLIDGLGRGLRLLHDRLTVAECPFDRRQPVLLASMRRRLAAGQIEAGAGGSAYDRLTPADKVAYAERTRPEEPSDDLVVAHGDFGLPNLLVDPPTGRLVGLVDLGRLGISDRHRDLAILVRSFIANFGPEHAWRLLDAYGGPVDPQRLDFHVLLDDLW